MPSFIGTQRSFLYASQIFHTMYPFHRNIRSSDNDFNGAVYNNDDMARIFDILRVHNDSPRNQECCNSRTNY